MTNPRCRINAMRWGKTRSGERVHGVAWEPESGDVPAESLCGLKLAKLGDEDDEWDYEGEFACIKCREIRGGSRFVV